MEKYVEDEFESMSLALTEFQASTVEYICCVNVAEIAESKILEAKIKDQFFSAIDRSQTGYAPRQLQPVIHNIQKYLKLPTMEKYTNIPF